MVDRIRWDTVSYLPFYYVFFQFLLLTIFNLQANILTTKDILSNLEQKKLFDYSFKRCVLRLVNQLWQTNYVTSALQTCYNSESLLQLRLAECLLQLYLDPLLPELIGKEYDHMLPPILCNQNNCFHWPRFTLLASGN